MEMSIIKTLADENLTADISGEYKRILTPVDLRHTQESEKAIQTAIRLSKEFGATFHILTVPFPVEDTLAYKPEVHKTEFEYFCDRIGKLCGVDVVSIFRPHESPKSTILSVSEDFDIDLIVMASHNPNLSDYIFRSNASNIALHFPGSVMVVR